jgi:hypothetical protein
MRSTHVSLSLSLARCDVALFFCLFCGGGVLRRFFPLGPTPRAPPPPPGASAVASPAGVFRAPPSPRPRLSISPRPATPPPPCRLWSLPSSGAARSSTPGAEWSVCARAAKRSQRRADRAPRKEKRAAAAGSRRGRRVCARPCVCERERERERADRERERESPQPRAVELVDWKRERLLEAGAVALAPRVIKSGAGADGGRPHSNTAKKKLSDHLRLLLRAPPRPDAHTHTHTQSTQPPR